MNSEHAFYLVLICQPTRCAKTIQISFGLPFTQKPKLKIVSNKLAFRLKKQNWNSNTIEKRTNEWTVGTIASHAKPKTLYLSSVVWVVLNTELICLLAYATIDAIDAIDGVQAIQWILCLFYASIYSKIESSLFLLWYKKWTEIETLFHRIRSRITP